jgi:hypothetical protein
VDADDLVARLFFGLLVDELDNFTASPDSVAGSMTSAAETISSSSWMRPSMKDWRSRAA